jgi:microcystin-dependent protein
MSDQFVAEIRMFAGNFAPKGWAFCNGQIMSISQNTALFSLLGTYYGGDGRSTFALPNLQGMMPLHQGQGAGLIPRVLGETGGSQNVTLLTTEMPAHQHGINASTAGGDLNTPANNNLAKAHTGKTSVNAYNSAATTQMNPLGVAGGGQPHNNLPPYLCVTFIIALQGIFPPRG